MKKSNSGWERISGQELIEQFPWIKDVEYSGGRFYVFSTCATPILKYEGGIWYSGNFFGDMYKCEFRGGHFHKWGCFNFGQWYNGAFEGFKMYKSDFYGGEIMNGYFDNSNFFGGNFMHGIFDEGSVWYDGTWGQTSIAKRKGNIYSEVPRKFVKKLRKKQKREQEKIVKDKTTENIEDVLAKGGTSKKKKVFKDTKPEKVKPKKVKTKAKTKKVNTKVKTKKIKTVKNKKINNKTKKKKTKRGKK